MAFLWGVLYRRRVSLQMRKSFFPVENGSCFRMSFGSAGAGKEGGAVPGHLTAPRVIPVRLRWSRSAMRRAERLNMNSSAPPEAVCYAGGCGAAEYESFGSGRSREGGGRCPGAPHGAPGYSYSAPLEPVCYAGGCGAAEYESFGSAGAGKGDRGTSRRPGLFLFGSAGGGLLCGGLRSG